MASRVYKLSRSKCWVAPIKIGGKKARFLIDTGAAVSVIDSTFYSEYCTGVCSPLKPCHCSLTTANGVGLNIHGEVEVSLKISGFDFAQTMVVADLQSCQGILGLDFLQDNSCVLDLAEGALKFHKQTVLLQREDCDLIARIKVEETVVVPPRSEMFVSCTLVHDTFVEHAEGVVEKLTHLDRKKQLEIPRCLVSVHDNKLSIPITNFSKQELRVKRNEVIAQIESTAPLNSMLQFPSQDSETQSPDIEDSNLLPEHLKSLLDGTSPKIKVETRQGVKDTLIEFQNAWLPPEGRLGRYGKTKHVVDTEANRPVKLPPRRYPLAQRDVVDKELDKMVEADIIEPSSSPWASNVVLVKKKDGSVRFCVDFRKLNAVTKKDAYPLPHIGDSLDALSGSRWFCTLDLAQGFFQVEMDEASKEKTAFNTHRGLFQFKVLPFGLCNSPATFQRMMEMVLSGILFERCLVYIDDVIVMGRTEEETLENLRQVLKKFIDANLKLKPSKCALFQEECTFLGHTISAEGTSCEKKKVEAVLEWPSPSNLTEVRSFLGTCSYYRKFIPCFADIACPLTNLTKKGVKFVWSSACQEAFETLKQRLVSAPVLAYPTREGQFILDTDASAMAIGAVLSQIQDGEERVIAYASSSLPKAKQNYCTTYRELYAVVRFVKHFSHFLWGRPFLVRTDHSSLRWLQNFKNPEGVVARWLATLGVYDFEIEHRKGSLHGNADGLSRIPRKKCLRPECEQCQNCTLPVHTLSVLVTKSVETQTNPPEPPVIPVAPAVAGAVPVPTQPPLPLSPSVQAATPEVITTPCPDSVPSPIESNWYDSWDADQLAALQTDDPVTNAVILKMRSGVRPQGSQLSGYSSAVRALFFRWEDLRLIHDLLYILVKDQVTGVVEPRLVAPDGIKAEVLKMVHDARSGGHLGREKTLSSVRKFVFWPGMTVDIANWCRECDTCARRKPGPGRAKHDMGHVEVGRPFQRIAIDILSPLTPSHDGYNYIMVVEDYFTKWVEAYSIVDHTAQSVGDKLLTEWMCRFGVPSGIHTDQGKEFDSNLILHLSKELGNDKTRTVPYNPRSDGMVERQNRTILQMLSGYVNEKHDNWSDHLPFLMMAYRAAKHETTGCSPNLVLFGRENSLPLTVKLGEQHFCQGAECPVQYVAWVRKTLEQVYAYVREKTAASVSKQKHYHDRNVRMHNIVPNMLVWRWYPPKARPKLGLGWTGPYRVLEMVGNRTAKIRCKNRELVVHLNDLKPYLGRRTLAEGESDIDSDPEEDPPLRPVSDPEQSFSEEEQDNLGPVSSDSGPSESEQEEVEAQRTRRGREVHLPARFRD